MSIHESWSLALLFIKYRKETLFWFGDRKKIKTAFILDGIPFTVLHLSTNVLFSLPSAWLTVNAGELGE